MFDPKFLKIINEMRVIPFKDLKNLMKNKDPLHISELDLLKLDYFNSIKFAKDLAVRSGITYIDLSKAKIADETLSFIKRSHILKYRILPVQKNSSAVSLAIFNPSLIECEQDLVTLVQYPVQFIFTNLAAWKKIFSRIKISSDELVLTIKEVKVKNTEKTTLKEEEIGEDVTHMVNKIFADSYLRKASDIHIEPYQKIFRIRLRIDGTLSELLRPNRKYMLGIISRIKVMAAMDISEKRKPQDGRMKLEMNGLFVDYRVSSMPTLFGEKIVLRLLDASSLELDMKKLGFEKQQLDLFMDSISKPYGICLVTGPTGSGKTTTLYSAVSDLNKVKSNISTIEDPVEFNLEGINQVNIQEKIGLTFRKCLQTLLRQDPDIIMIGEIRDAEVAEIAIEAALTGHLVLSTLHTNDAPSTIIRILNMGLEPFLVTGAINVIVAQRLCRKICEHCKVVYPATEDELISCGVARSSVDKITVYHGTGCVSCSHLGYRGRVAIYEVLEISQKIKELILKNTSSDELKKTAIMEGMKTLRMSALTKVLQGVTTLEEAVTNSRSDK